MSKSNKFEVNFLQNCLNKGLCLRTYLYFWDLIKEIIYIIALYYYPIINEKKIHDAI